MGNLLFSPSGRIGPAAYMKGILALAVIGFLGGFTALLGPAAAVGFFIGLMVLYCFIALGIKRSHDAGKSGWMVLVQVLIWVIVLMVLGFVLQKVTGVGVSDIFSAAMSQDLEALEEIEAKTMSISYIIMSGLAGVAGKVITGFVVNMMNKSNDHDNQYGPATVSDS